MIFDSIFKLMSNPIVLIVGFGLIAAVVVLVIIQETLKRSFEVWQFSEGERLIDIYPVPKRTPKMLKSPKHNKRFIRNSPAYTLKRGAKTIVVWLGKLGTAYTWKPSDTEEGKQVVVGTLFQGLENVLGEEAMQDLTPEAKNKLLESKIFVTVDLESGHTPTGLPTMSEQDVNTEANNDMASLIGHRIKNALVQQDFIKLIGVAGTGGLLVLILQGLGILPSFGG